jgi:hypothetical protein
LFKLTKVFACGAGDEPRELPLAVAEEGKAKVVSCQAYLPLVQAICNPGLRERHWEALAELLGYTIKQDEVGAWHGMAARHAQQCFWHAAAVSTDVPRVVSDCDCSLLAAHEL